MLSGQLKYIFSIPLLSKTFRMDFSASPFSSVSFSNSSSTHLACLLLSLSFTFVSLTVYSSSPCWLQFYLTVSERSEKPHSLQHLLSREILFITVRLKSLIFFPQLYFSMSSSPNWDNSNLFWKATYTDKLLIDGHGCSGHGTVFFICSKKVSAF